MFTAASASHIKVVVKDDTLGLGARSKRDSLDEPTGLDAFKGLLGRLNGKSDDQLQADQKKRDDVKLARYAANKWQTVRFISGGLLAQEKEDEPRTIIPERHSLDARETIHSAHKGGQKATPITSNCSDQGADGKSTDGKTKHTRSRKRQGKKDKEKTTEKSKEIKRENRVEKPREEKKEKKRKHTEQPEESDNSSLREQSSEQNNKLGKRQDFSSNVSSTKEHRPLGRTMIRGRHIAQKRKALMDEKSLNEVLPQSIPKARLQLMFLDLHGKVIIIFLCTFIYPDFFNTY